MRITKNEIITELKKNKTFCDFLKTKKRNYLKNKSIYTLTKVLNLYNVDNPEAIRVVFQTELDVLKWKKPSELKLKQLGIAAYILNDYFNFAKQQNFLSYPKFFCNFIEREYYNKYYCKNFRPIFADL